MILTAHQPVYLPWLGLFHKIALADKFILFDKVQYVPKDWISRNYVKTVSGQALLTVPVFTKGHRQKVINQIEINNDLPWARKHWSTIRLNYKKAEYFKLYSDFFEDVYKKEWRLLSDLDFYMLRWLLKTLGINVAIEKANDHDFHGIKADLVLDMCVKLKASVYIFGALGADYADTEKFKKSGVTPVFQTYVHPVYKQLHGEFIPYMSVVDLLFNEGPRSLDIIMSNNVGRRGLVNLSEGLMTKS